MKRIVNKLIAWRLDMIILAVIVVVVVAKVVKGSGIL